MPSTIGACGFIGTASSAVSDFLKEFEENQALDKFEFKIGYMTDGIDDLRYHLTTGSMKYESGTTAIRRFQKLIRSYATKNYRKATNGEFIRLSDQYLNNIIQNQWIGITADPVIQPARNFMVRAYTKFDLFKKPYEKEKRSGSEDASFPKQKLYFSVYPENFITETVQYTKNILTAMGKKPNKNVILDQPFPGNNPTACMCFFENPIAIIVDRDPRDLFIQYAVTYYPTGGRQYPIFDVHQYIDVYRRMRDRMPYLEPSDRVMNVKFEEMIYEYNQTSAKIADFCNLKMHNKGSYFNPDMSIRNTQLFRRYNDYAEQIKEIEKSLPEYLFDFEKYQVNLKELGEPFENNPLNPTGKKWKGN